VDAASEQQRAAARFQVDELTPTKKCLQAIESSVDELLVTTAGLTRSMEALLQHKQIDPIMILLNTMGRDLRNLHSQNRVQNRKISDSPQNLQSPAKSRKILCFSQVTQNLQIFRKIYDFFAKFDFIVSSLSSL